MTGRRFDFHSIFMSTSVAFATALIAIVVLPLQGYLANAEHFSGFVNYRNNVGMQWMTSLAIPALFTGQYFESPSAFDEYMMSPFRRGSFIEEYIKHDNPVYVNCGPYEFGYTNRKGGNSADVRRAFPSVMARMQGTYRFTVDELAFVRCLPYAVKYRYLQYITKRDVASAPDSEGNLEDDGWLWRTLSQGESDLPDSVALHIHHSRGGHYPICLREDGSFVQLENATYEDYVGQATYSLRQLGTFLDALREKGVYDCSTIVVLADHSNTYVRKDYTQPAGVKNGFPFLMVKARGATDGFQESQIPTSHSKIASLVGALRCDSHDRAGIEKILTTPLRLLREDCDLVQYENENAPYDKHVLIIKDSFSLPLIAWMSTLFRAVDVVDLRYYHPRSVSGFIERSRLDMVLVMYNPGAFAVGKMWNFGLEQHATRRMTPIAALDHVVLPASDNDYNNTIIASRLKSNSKYRVMADRADIGGKGVDVLDFAIYDRTNRKIVRRTSVRTDEVDWTFVVPGGKNRYDLHVYAGKIGKTSGNSLEIDGLRVFMEDR